MGIQSRPICPDLIHDHGPGLLTADMWRVGQTSRLFEYRRHNCQDSLDEFSFLSWLCDEAGDELNLLAVRHMFSSLQQDGTGTNFQAQDLIGLAAQILALMEAGLPVQLVGGEIEVSICADR